MKTEESNEKKKVYSSWEDFEDQCWHNVNAGRAAHNRDTHIVWCAVFFLLFLKLVFVTLG